MKPKQILGMSMTIVSLAAPFTGAAQEDKPPKELSFLCIHGAEPLLKPFAIELSSGAVTRVSMKSCNAKEIADVFASGKVSLAVSDSMPMPHGAAISSRPIAIKALLVAAPPSSSATKLTTEQVKGLLDGSINDWSQLGLPQKKLRLYVVESSKGLFPKPTAHKHGCNCEECEEQPHEKSQAQTAPTKRSHISVPSSSKAVALLARDEDGIAIVDASALAEKDAKLLAVDDVLPTHEALSSGAYTLSTKYFLTIPQKEGWLHRRATKHFDGDAFITTLSGSPFIPAEATAR